MPLYILTVTFANIGIVFYICKLFVRIVFDFEEGRWGKIDSVRILAAFIVLTDDMALHRYFLAKPQRTQRNGYTACFANLAALREIAMTSSHGNCDDCVSFYIVADCRTHSLSFPSFLLRDDAGREWYPPSHNVFRSMRTEQHTDGNVVCDVTDDATNQWWKYVGPNHKPFYAFYTNSEHTI